MKYTDPDGRSENYSIDGVWLGYVDDDINGIHVYNKSTENQFQDKGFLIDTDGQLITIDVFHQTVAMIYGEATGQDITENKGMGEVVKNRMDESSLNLIDVLDNKYSHFDARDHKTPLYLSGLEIMKDKSSINNLDSIESKHLRNAIAGTIHGLTYKNSVLSEKPFYWSHGINRNSQIYKKIDTIKGCDFYTLTEVAWKINKRNWP